MSILYTSHIVNPIKVETRDERADIMTKAMTKDDTDYYKFRDDIMNDHSD